MLPLKLGVGPDVMFSSGLVSLGELSICHPVDNLYGVAYLYLNKIIHRKTSSYE